MGPKSWSLIRGLMATSIGKENDRKTSSQSPIGGMARSIVLIGDHGVQHRLVSSRSGVPMDQGFGVEAERDLLSLTTWSESSNKCVPLVGAEPRQYVHQPGVPPSTIPFMHDCCGEPTASDLQKRALVDGKWAIVCMAELVACEG